MANKKTNKKVTNKKQSSGKRNSAGSKSIANYLIQFALPKL